MFTPIRMFFFEADSVSFIGLGYDTTRKRIL